MKKKTTAKKTTVTRVTKKATKKKTAKKKTSLSAALAPKSREHPPNVIVEACPGTGKTFVQIVGVAWSFLPHRWKEVQQEIARRNGLPRNFKIEPSEEQALVWEAMAQSRGKVRSVTYCAFNKSIVNDFSQEWGWMRDMLAQDGIMLQFATINSLGNSTISRAYGRIPVSNNRTENLIAAATRTDIWKLRRENPTLLKATSELTGLAKLTLVGWSERGFATTYIYEELDQLVSQYDIQLEGDNYHLVMDLVPRILERSRQVGDLIDFDDQNWLPVVNNLAISKVDLLLVDEGQDLPRCKQEFARRLGRRVILVGDPHQAIYGFAGADTKSMFRMRSLLSTNGQPLVPLNLTETRRCGKAIVEEARKLVPEFRAHPDNHDGVVRRTTLAKYADTVQDSDMVLCRVNAPLVSQALRFIKDGRKANIRGREFGTSLVNFVKQFKAEDLEDLTEKVDRWYTAETAKEGRKRNPSEARLIALDDRRQCITSFTEGAETVDDVIDKIELVFTGKVCPSCGRKYKEEVDRCSNRDCPGYRKQPGAQYPTGPKLVVPEGVQFSSVHRAKGLESDVVYVLQPPGAQMPHPSAKTPEQQEQEMNCLFIALTRAKKELVHVR